MIEAKTISIQHDDAREAGALARGELFDVLGKAPDFVLLFVAGHLDAAVVMEGFGRDLPARTRVVGCSTFAEIGEEGGLTRSVTAMGLCFGGGVEAEGFLVENLAGREREAGRSLGEQAKAFGPKLLVLLADGLVNTDRLVLGMQDVLGSTFPIVGGMAIDDGRFERAYEILDRRVISGGAVALGLRGPVELVAGAKSGWVPIGATHTCTRVENGNVVLEIDGRPALDLYLEYLGPRAGEMPSVSADFPIGIVGGLDGVPRVEGESIALLRSVKGVDEARRALVFGGDIPEGAKIRMTRATRDDVIRGANEVGAKLVASMPKPSLALFFDCGGRKMVLGPRYREELGETFARLEGVPKVGFYCAGEFSPVDGVTMHHDETFTMALLRG
ncbi:FIST N-terminal domain-containing protein [Polyangium sp. 6x1]|uniref:FIST signal transduction protein n=1 Tax=Polyangium sp. 6x1 TaxID=3042689 RepID=UPI0024830EC9|nr:FIST N-terminal domain-containing protein [Polyangium sp. 6x1]MDI1450083.1 FIST N-terminal domain-containing protein [Polyangium sp. 6x1]